MLSHLRYVVFALDDSQTNLCNFISNTIVISLLLCVCYTGIGSECE